MKRAAEEWRDVRGYEGTYQVSNFGRAKSLERKIVFKNGSSRTWPEIILKPMTGANGYAYVSPCVCGENAPQLVHRLILDAFIGPCPDGMECCHNNGNALDNRIDNLRWDTRKNNHADKLLHGTSNQGERCGTSKLTEMGVRVIRRLAKITTMSQRQIGEVFGVTQGAIHLVLSGKTWGHIDG